MSPPHAHRKGHPQSLSDHRSELERRLREGLVIRHAASRELAPQLKRAGCRWAPRQRVWLAPDAATRYEMLRMLHTYAFAGVSTRWADVEAEQILAEAQAHASSARCWASDETLDLSRDDRGSVQPGDVVWLDDGRCALVIHVSAPTHDEHGWHTAFSAREVTVTDQERAEVDDAREFVRARRNGH